MTSESVKVVDSPDVSSALPPEAAGNPVARTGVDVEGWRVVGSGDGSLLAFFEYRFIPDVTSDRMVDRLYFQRMGDEITRSDWVRAMEFEVLGRARQKSFRRLLNELGMPPQPHFIGYQGETPGCLTELHDEQGRFYVLRARTRPRTPWWCLSRRGWATT